MIPGILAEARAELAGCEQGGRHRPTRNEHADAWCSKCGERLLLPFAAGWRRLVDWMLAQLIVVVLLRIDTTGGGPAALAPVGVFALQNLLLVSLTGSTLGHRLFGMQVWQVRPGAFPLQVVIRTLLLCLVVPALLTSRDGRAYHDVAAGTRIVRP